MLALHHRCEPFQPHPGINAGLGQARPGAVCTLFELHEHQIPDLDEPVAILVGRARRSAPDVIPVIVKDFRAGPARSGITHRPEIVRGGDADDALLRQAGDLAPQIERFVVGVIDSDGELIRREAPFLGQQSPGMDDRLFLEIIAEREVPEHFKECMVARSIADIIQIIVLAPGADAFLRRDGARDRPGLEAREDVLERDHARIGEHQRRIIIRHQRRRGDRFVTTRHKVIEE